jgi:CheY-like chemotaxis protein
VTHDSDETRSVATVESLQAIGRLVSHGGHPVEILASAVPLIRACVGAEMCLLYVSSRSPGQSGDTTAAGEAPLRLVLVATTDAVAHADAATSAMTEALAVQAAETLDTQLSDSLMAMPVLYRGELQGAIVLHVGEPRSSADLAPLVLAATQLAPVLADARGVRTPVVAAPAPSAVDSAALQKITRTITHDLNNRLMLIVGHAELLVEEARRLANADLEEGCAAVRDSGYEAAKLAQQLLQIGKQPLTDPSQELGAVSDPPAPPAPEPDRRSSFQSHRVLIVDDDERMLELIEAVLRSKLGCCVERASNGVDAASALDHADFNLVLSDIVMPRMNGVELLQWVDTHRPHVAPRIVFMTGDVSSKGPGSEIHRAGRPVLCKPFSVETLVSVAERILTGS